MTAVEYGTGYISIVPSAKGIKSDLADTLEDQLVPASADAGEAAGEEFGEGFDVTSALAIAGIATAIGATLVVGIGEALDRGALTDKLGAQLALSPADTARAGALAGDLYADAYGDSFESVTEQLGQTLRQFGPELSDADAYNLTAGAIDLTAAFDLDAERLAQTTGVALRTGLADSAGEAQDVITAALQNIQAPAADVLDTLYEFSEPLVSLGLDGEAAIGVLSSAANAGVFDLTKAGDALKEISIRAVDGSAGTAEAYRLLGLDADNLTASIAQGGPAAQTAFGEILTALDGVADPVAKETAGVALFGTTFEDLGADAIAALNPLNAEMADVTGSTEALGTALNDNLKTDIEVLKRQGMDVLVTVIETAVVPALQLLVGVVETVVGFFERNRAATVGLVAGLGTLAVILGVMAIQAAITAIANFTLAGSMLAVAWPILAVVVAVGLLVAGLVWAYENVEIFRTAVDAVWAFLKDDLLPIFGDVAGFITDDLIPAVADIAGAIVGFGADVVDLAVTVGEKIGDIVGWFLDLNDDVAGVFDDVGGYIVGLVDAVTELPGKIADGAAGLFDSVKDEAKRVFNSIAGLWNNSVGSIGFTFPEWVPKLGGRSFSVPDVPILHDGGIVPGRPGTETLILAEAGELVVSRQNRAAGGVVFNGPVTVASPDEFVRVINRRQRIATLK